MLAYITRRLVYGMVTLLALSMIVFSLLQMTGGGPLDRLKLNPRMGPYIDSLTELWGLDQPAWKQYMTWLKNYTTLEVFQLQNLIPVIAIATAISGTLLIAKFVIPSFQDLFTKLHVQLPAFTRGFICVTNWLGHCDRRHCNNS